MQMVCLKNVNKVYPFSIFFLVFINLSINSQSIDKIKEKDTIYIYIDLKEEYTGKFKRFNNNSEFDKNFIAYKFELNHANTIHFISNTYKNSDNFVRGIKNDERIEEKSFLKRNKDIILGIDFFIKNGFKNTFNLLYKKTIYVIDKDEIKGRKIKVKQVDMACFTCFEE